MIRILNRAPRYKINCSSCEHQLSFEAKDEIKMQTDIPGIGLSFVRYIVCPYCKSKEFTSIKGIFSGINYDWKTKL